VLLHVSNNSRDDDDIEGLIPITIRWAVALLFIGPFVKSIGDGQVRSFVNLLSMILLLLPFSYL
jgi:hypothetical protein